MLALRPHPCPVPERREALRLGMMQLSPFGLSEPWLLRHLGDRHWELIAEASGLSGTAFRDDTGRPVYAAFCATSLHLERHRDARLGASLEIVSTLHQVAPHRIGSVHHLFGPEGCLGRLSMISCFLSHDESGSNRRLLRNRLPGLRALPPAPAGLAGFHESARVCARRMRPAPATAPELARYTPVPAHDFNAAGLLYFPTFSRAAEMAQPAQAPLLSREVVYLGNLDTGETISARAASDCVLLVAGEHLLGSVRTRVAS
ncbi:Pnap_2097 family protein [Tropicimonas sp. IMCC34043]|uniref:Pnap_2097 family protein n=1 Tax=Tropicimonas sp. IMCC34043 TaxID=2248760 RepID=UPI000E21D75A|nr:Pnap_2097 family protein [Tropicimonas sp. IMCC34043]